MDWNYIKYQIILYYMGHRYTKPIVCGILFVELMALLYVVYWK